MTDYTSKDITVLSDIEHVRKRTQIYLGSMHDMDYKLPVFTNNKIDVTSTTFTPAVLKSFGEIVDNSVDELNQFYSKRHKLIIESNTKLGKYTVTDNGRGIPITMHESGKFTPELALANLRSGRNFTDNKKAGVIGMNGVGSACTNYVSKMFKVTINRDDKKYVQVFEDGCSYVGQPIITKEPSRVTGTSIEFELDGTVFKNTSLPEDLIREKCRGLAFTNPGMEVKYNKESFKYKNGLEDVISEITDKYFKFSYTKDDKTIEFFIVFDNNTEENEQVFTWLNSSLLFDGGCCNTQFVNAFTEKVIAHLDKDARKQKCKITKNDVKDTLLIFGNIKISDPEFDSQSKTRLVGPTLRKEMNELVDEAWNSFSRKNKDWLELVLERAYNRFHKKENEKAINDHTKINRKRVEGFKDATSKNRGECEIYITEGLSASSQIQSSRNPRHQATFALTGKINNVYGTTPAQLLKMGKITNMLTVLGLTPGVKATKQNLNFGKIIIATDADPDGADIFSLLINIFYRFWPELFKMDIPIVYRLNAPNIAAYNKKNRIHFPNMADYLKVENKYKGYTIAYYKGLGSMINEDWKIILSDLEHYILPMKYDDKFDEVIELLFNDNADDRKKWLS